MEQNYCLAFSAGAKRRGPLRGNVLRNFGGDGEDRTPDLCNANATLSQLSYAPIAIELYHISPENLLSQAVYEGQDLGLYCRHGGSRRDSSLEGRY